MELFELEGFEILSIEENEHKLPVYHLNPINYSGVCPVCSDPRQHPHSYHTRKIHDLLSDGRRVVLAIHGRRYRCYNCGKVFGEIYPGMDYKSRMTTRLRDAITKDCLSSTNLSEVARKYSYTATAILNFNQALREKRKKEEGGP